MRRAYVTISGNSGVGKSTLLRAVGDILGRHGVSAYLVDERRLHHANLLEMFRKPDRWAYPVQLNFIVQRYGHLLAWRDGLQSEDVVVMERCLDEDALFFNYYVGLGEIEGSLSEVYKTLHRSIKELAPRPDIVVHLRGDDDVLCGRLQRAYENGEREPELVGERLRGYLAAMQSYYGLWAESGNQSYGEYIEMWTDRPDYSCIDAAHRVYEAVMRVGDVA